MTTALTNRPEKEDFDDIFDLDVRVALSPDEELAVARSTTVSQLTGCPGTPSCTCNAVY